MVVKLAPKITWGGRVWRLLYDPADPATVMPNFEGATVTYNQCPEVNVPGVGAPQYLAVVDVVFPSQLLQNGRVTPERVIKGFRLYGHQVKTLQELKSQEMVYYIAEPRPGMSGGAQAWLDAVLGGAVEESARENALDTSWRQILGEQPVMPPETAPEPVQPVVKNNAVVVGYGNV